MSPSKKPVKSRYKTGKPAKPLAVAVAEPPAAAYATPPATARVFQSGNSQAVRLPKEFRFRSRTVQIFRRGEDIILREKPMTLGELLERIGPMPEDFPDDIPDSPAEPVEDL